ncbi:MAG: tetratricopeptide repeat protein [Ideonella sp.]|nr:tetratricopeptide repeat protein [Ideonella sp.]MCC7457660.1 tetratricopeptide repeat protein [Nitrospira sp.]
MALKDPRGNLLGTDEPAARDAVERALWRMMSFYDTPLADLDRAAQADPQWSLPHVMKAGFLLSLTEPSLRGQARQHLQHAESLLQHAPDAFARERAHCEATRRVLDGRWLDACTLWDAWLLEHPRDALALQWAHLWDFYRGDAAHLRARPARALPEWDEADALFAHVLALHAFGLEECNLHAQAEATGRRALALDAGSPWAIHAVAHVMEMQGRFDDGAAWLRQQQRAWAEGNGYACHLWWHLALFRLEGLDEAGVLRLVDAHLAGDALQVTLQRVDAAAMLWRLHLLGLDVRTRAAALVAQWDLADDSAGYYAFNDVHALLAMLAADDGARAEHWVARCAAHALEAGAAARSNHAMAGEVGAPLMRALLAFARGDAAAAVQGLYDVRTRAQRFGGSHAQRDLVDQTLLAAAAADARNSSTGHAASRAIGRAVLNERRAPKPATPLTRHWAARLGVVLP